ncbi:MAG: hypothetical protein QM764_24560 [Chitinophagaceae bacterium]
MHTDWSQFIGRFHPLLVHLPIGILLFAALLNLIANYRKSEGLNFAVSIALLIAAVSAVVAIISGLLLSSADGYDTSTLNTHKWIGIITSVLVFIIWIIRRSKTKDFIFLRLQFSNWLLLISIVLIAIGSHLGGKMTHGDGYLTRYMPAWLKGIFCGGLQVKEQKILPPLDSVIVYRDIIQPILTTKCVSCHNENKRKGELDLSTIDGIRKGGKSGKTIVAGDPEKSELFYRITLPSSSSKYMPADNSFGLTPIEISFIQQWIQHGADFAKNVTQANEDEKTKYLIASYLGISAESDKEIKLPSVMPADSVVVRQLQDAKILVHPLTSKSNLLEASFVMVQNLPANEITSLLQKLLAVKSQLYRLDVSNCNLNKDAIKTIAEMQRLNKIEIQKANLADETLEPISAMQTLEFLNAGQNPITDKSSATFQKMKALKKLNLWKTGITEQAAKKLESQLPGITIER